MTSLPTEREARVVAMWIEHGALLWLDDAAPGHPVAEALWADFNGRVAQFALARDLSDDEALRVIAHEAAAVLELPADPLPPLPGRRRRGRRGGRRNKRNQMDGE